MREMDEASAYLFSIEIDDPWSAVGLPLPDGLDSDQLQRARVIIYPIIQALDWTLDESLPLIGRLAEIDRRLEMQARDRRRPDPTHA